MVENNQRRGSKDQSEIVVVRKGIDVEKPVLKPVHFLLVQKSSEIKGDVYQVFYF